MNSRNILNKILPGNRDAHLCDPAKMEILPKKILPEGSSGKKGLKNEICATPR